MVHTTLTDSDGKVINVDYKVRRYKSGRFKLVDIVAEGVSMVMTHRSEFHSVVSRDGLDVLIEKLGIQTKIANN